MGCDRDTFIPVGDPQQPVIRCLPGGRATIARFPSGWSDRSGARPRRGPGPSRVTPAPRGLGVARRQEAACVPVGCKLPRQASRLRIAAGDDQRLLRRGTGVVAEDAAMETPVVGQQAQGGGLHRVGVREAGHLGSPGSTGTRRGSRPRPTRTESRPTPSRPVQTGRGLRPCTPMPAPAKGRPPWRGPDGPSRSRAIPALERPDRRAS